MCTLSAVTSPGGVSRVSPSAGHQFFHSVISKSFVGRHFETLEISHLLTDIDLLVLRSINDILDLY